MAFVVPAASCKIYRENFSYVLLLTFLLHFVTFLYSLALKFKNYSYSIAAYARRLNDTGAFTVWHHIFTIMYNTTDDFNKINVKVSFRVKQKICVYTPL
jgi:vacuolar-type H+-ATPase subunit I/STV1